MSLNNINTPYNKNIIACLKFGALKCQTQYIHTVKQVK